jgi:hypothetical protein
MLPEKELITRISKIDEFRPLTINEIKPIRDYRSYERYSSPPVTLSVEWDGHRRQFLAECREMSTPKVISSAIERARSLAGGTFLPMVLVPYLSPEALEHLEEEHVSGLDLCGNGIIIVPGEWLIVRTGNKNNFPTSAPIKNVFRGTSSLAARVFLSHPSYKAVTEVQEEVKRKEGRIHISTVSKVLQALEEELVIRRTKEKIELIDAPRLLDLLTENFRPPELARRTHARVQDVEAFVDGLKDSSEEAEMLLVGDTLNPLIHDGERTNRAKRVFVTSIEAFHKKIEPCVTPTSPGVVELLETGDLSIYFDRRWENGFPWTSRLQSYLELAVRGGSAYQNQVKELRSQLLFGLPSGEAK